MTSSDWACTGATSVPSTIDTSTIDRSSTLTGGSLCAARQSELLQICASVDNLGSIIISTIGSRDHFLVIIPGLGLVSRLFGRCRCAHIGTEPVRFLCKCCFESGKRFPGITAFKQHDAIEFAGRLGHAWRHRMLLGLVLGIGGGAHCIERLTALALGVKDPGSGDLPLNINLFRPIAILCVTQLVPQFGKLGDVGLGGLRIAGTGRSERSRTIRDRLHVCARTGSDLKFGGGLPV